MATIKENMIQLENMIELECSTKLLMSLIKLKLSIRKSKVNDYVRDFQLKIGEILKSNLTKSDFVKIVTAMDKLQLETF